MTGGAGNQKEPVVAGSSYLQSINAHYNREQLSDRIRASFRQGGKDFGSLTRDDLTVFDEFHVKGRRATRELAAISDIEPGIRLLDIGCGVGGPARTLAAEWGCRVIGLDIVEEYCRAALRLTAAVHLDHQVAYANGNGSALPFAKGVFDRVWIQHATMNIAHKKPLFEEIRRVLRPEGRLVMHEVFSGAATPPIYPVPWASDSDIDFLVDPDRFGRILNTAGFEAIVWEDVSQESLAWFEKVSPMAVDRCTQQNPLPGIHLLMGETTPQKMVNMVKNLKEDRIRIVRAVLRIINEKKAR